MGKDLKGKELGKGISQRKDGYYTARFRNRDGKDVQKYFKKLQDCRNWIAEARFQDEHGGIHAMQDMTVNAWAEYWLENIKKPSVRYQTYLRYRERLTNHVLPCMSKILLSEVKPVNCQSVLNRMESEHYSAKTISSVRTVMVILFNDAVDNELIIRSPVKKSVKCNGFINQEKTILTSSEQEVFLGIAKKTKYYNQYVLVLQTGLRSAELAGLKWTDNDLRRKVLHVQRNLNYFKKNGITEWELGPTKSKSGNRYIPLTEEAILALKRQKELCHRQKVIDINYADYFFLNMNGHPIHNTVYNSELKKICLDANISHVTLHGLRHTFATRCAESGVS